MHGGVIDDHAALGHHFLNVAQAQRVSGMPAHAREHHLQGGSIRLITLRSASIINIIPSSASAQVISIGLLRQG